MVREWQCAHCSRRVKERIRICDDCKKKLPKS